MVKMATESLATWAVNLSPHSLPQDVLKKAEDVIIDAIACALPGSSADGAQRVHAVAKSTLFGKGAMLYCGSKTPVFIPQLLLLPTPRQYRCWI